MGRSADNQARDEAVPEMDIDICDGCGQEFSKHDLRECRSCGEKLCKFCEDLHECDDEYPSRPPKKDVDKSKKM